MGKKIISFSLYGKSPDYTLGAVANARHVSKAYPGWICRFYVADDVPENIISRLKDYDTEVINMGQRLEHEAKFWRFFPAVDPEVDITLFRDSDSRFTKCELLMVNEWLDSGKKFHVMRTGDYPYPVLAGLWGVRGNIPNWKETLETLQLAMKTETVRVVDEKFLRNNIYPQMKGNVFVHEFESLRVVDEKFLHNNIYPQMKGNVFVHEFESCPEQTYFMNETIHPFPPIAKYKRGKYLNISIVPVGLKMPSRRIFIAFSIYKRTIFSERFLTIWLNTMEKTELFHDLNARFYVADNISPNLVERLRRLGRVILKPAKTVHKDDPQYWKLQILSEKNPGLAIIADFWKIFFLVRARAKNRQIGLYEVPPIQFNHNVPSGIRNGFSNVTPLSVCLPPPVSDIENLIEQRNPKENYRAFIHSTVYPRTSTMRVRMVNALNKHETVGPLKNLAKILFTPQLYRTVGDLKNRAMRNIKMLIFWKQ